MAAAVTGFVIHLLRSLLKFDEMCCEKLHSYFKTSYWNLYIKTYRYIVIIIYLFIIILRIVIELLTYAGMTWEI